MADIAEVDRLILQLASSRYGEAIDQLAAIGEPALTRLLQVHDGSMQPEFDGGFHPRDTWDNLTAALTAVGRDCLDAFLDAARREERLNNMSVIWALGFIDDERVVDLLLAAMTSRKSVVRWAAVHGLRQHADRRAIEPLIRAARDRDSLVRETVSRSRTDTPY